MITWYDPTAANSAKTIQDLGGSIVEEKRKVKQGGRGIVVISLLKPIINE
jgi:hypothetical protein